MTTFPRPSVASESQEPDSERTFRVAEEGHLVQAQAFGEGRDGGARDRGPDAEGRGYGVDAREDAAGEGQDAQPLAAEARPEAEGHVDEHQRPAQAGRRAERRRVAARGRRR